MRIIHTADIHLGAAPDKKRTWSKLREKEIWQTFEALIGRVKEEQPDLFIIAGDLFHRPPMERELREVAALFADIAPIPVVLIAGNHDYIRKNSLYERFAWSDNVIFLKDSIMSRVELKDLATDIYGLSYTEQEILAPVYDHVEPQDESRINILVAHGGDEKHAPIRFQRLPVSGFDYVALGHIHKTAWARHANFAYAGSLEPIDCTETGEHGYLDVDVRKEGCTVQFVPFAKRNYKMLRIAVDLNATLVGLRRSVSTAISEEGEEHLYHIVFEGERHPDFQIDCEEIYMLGNVAKVEDETKISYDFEKLKRENEDNMLGVFIDSFAAEDLSEIESKALAYGVQALLDAEQ